VAHGERLEANGLVGRASWAAWSQPASTHRAVWDTSTDEPLAEPLVHRNNGLSGGVQPRRHARDDGVNPWLLAPRTTIALAWLPRGNQGPTASGWSRASTLRRGVVANVGTGGEISVLEPARTDDELCGGRSPIEHAPPRDGEILKSRARVERLRDAFGIVAEIRLADGLRAPLA